VLTSIDASGVTQKTLHVWEEDVVGDQITPLPIDWKVWRAARKRIHQGNSKSDCCRTNLSFISKIELNSAEKASTFRTAHRAHAKFINT
jgi:hypothetical protein